MVLIEGGTFKMGSGAGDPDARDDEKPSHTVVVSPFLIGKHEVSQAEWERAGEQVTLDVSYNVRWGNLSEAAVVGTR